MNSHPEAFHILKDRGGFFEVFQEWTYVGHRHAKDGTLQRVEVTILDAGPEQPEQRFRAIAMTRDGRQAKGSASPTLEQSLGTIDWRVFDT